MAARVGWLFALLSIILSGFAGLYVASVSRDAIERDIGALHANRAQHLADAIDVDLDSSFGAMQLASGLLAASQPLHSSETERRLIDAIKLNLKEAIWIGVADRDGTVVAGDSSLLEHTSLASRSWFASALLAPTVGGPEMVLELAGLAANDGGTPPTFLAVAVPMKEPGGTVFGVAVAFFNMNRIRNVWRKSDSGLAHTRQAEVFLFDGNGSVLMPLQDGLPAPAAGFFDELKQAIAADSGAQTSGSLVYGRYLLGYATALGARGDGLTGLKVIVRESLDAAYASANQVAAVITLSCIFLGISLSVAAAVTTTSMLARLSRIAQSADALRLGGAQEFAEVDGRDEVARISRSLAMLFNNLKASNLELADLNLSLEEKVAERTREVHRLSEETRSAAITRERLRLSRDLHDTLAHSMLAMLTQIRLIQKLAKRKPELVQEELSHAEQAAQEGLARAREAVTELRYYAVRDDGLAQALRKLVVRLKERVEIEVSVDIGSEAAALAGPKAEMAYRIAEEALHNIERHAGASHASIHVSISKATPGAPVLTLTVEDDGNGFDPGVSKPGHFGLLGMREQASAAGGMLNMTSVSKSGTRIQFDVPL